MNEETAYLLKRHIREGCQRCPFCYEYGIESTTFDDRFPGKVIVSMKCRKCRQEWSVEYHAKAAIFRGERIT